MLVHKCRLVLNKGFFFTPLGYVPSKDDQIPQYNQKCNSID